MIRLLVLTLALPINVIACTCADFFGPVTIKDYNKSEFIISGKAIKVTIKAEETVGRQRQIEFRVDEVFKGKIDSNRVMIYTPASDASCGLLVKENEEWVIWAYVQDNVLSTSLCTRSKQKKHLPDSDYNALKYFKSNPVTSEWKNDAGVLIAVGTLKDNMPVGYWRYFYNNGYIESEGAYKNGVYNGKWIRYLDPEDIVKRLRYVREIPEDSIPDLHLLQHKTWEIQNFKDGVREGEFIRYAYFSIDKPIQITNYKNGKLDGKSIAYFDNGIIYYEQNYKDGRLNGYERFYHSNGQLKQEGKFVQSKATGEFRLYNETGELIKTAVGRRPE